jgi:disulfide bond formation protein DsbB
MQQQFTDKNLLTFLGLASFAALAAAYISQYGYGFQPCILCLYQRMPFFIVIILAFLSLFSALYRWQKLLLLLAILVILANAFLALYHFGVEQKFFSGPSTCSSNFAPPNNLAELKQIINQTKAIRCDQPSLIFLKLSMAAWNVLYCLGLVVLALLFLLKSKNN